MGETGTVVDLASMDAVFSEYEGQQGALIPILQRAQALYGYLPPDVLQGIADRLNISLGKVYAVATFYAQFYLERRGRHVLKVCDGTACHVKGAQALMTAVEDEYGVGADSTTKDGQLTVEIVYCMGSCALAPVAVVDGHVMGRMRRETLLRQVKRQVTSDSEISGSETSGSGVGGSAGGPAAGG
jgi:NADH-quinone oxidoreductase subunit E